MQDKFVDGLVSDDSNQYMVKQKDKGYSFCNCRNIFFTDWKNIKKEEYNKDYYDKYSGENILKISGRIAEKYIPMIIEINKTAESFFEIGSINDRVLNVAKENNFSTTGLDINPHVKSKKHKIITGNFEEVKIDKKFDVIWASHVFEHFKDPIGCINRCKEFLEPNGLLFIAMPDPFFINWANPYTWNHWVVNEHHILWDMDSFIDCVLQQGFQIKHASRHVGVEFYLTSGDFHLIFEKI